jgi:hypothetical protein
MGARKRSKIISSLRGSGKKMKKGTSGRLGSRRRRKIGLKPEVKFVNNSSGFPDVIARDIATTSLRTGDYINLITFPAQGQSDSGRIGDTILGKKHYIRMSFTARLTSGYYRVIIFNLKKEINTASDLPNFWQTSLARQATSGIINREVVNKVFYDKTRVFRFDQSGVASGTYANSFMTFNVAMNWPIIFSNGGLVPKDPRNNLFIACIGASALGTTVDTVVCGTLVFNSNFYYTDP